MGSRVVGMEAVEVEAEEEHDEEQGNGRVVVVSSYCVSLLTPQ